MEVTLTYGQTCFNSSMVRLGVFSTCRSEKHFYVSIPVWFDWEVIEIPNSIFKLLCFNSSMVRLGVCCVFRPHQLYLMFQFQYGSIGR